MSWLWLVLGAQLLFSLGAHLDKYLLSKYFPQTAPGALILFSSLFSLVVVPALAAIEPDVLSIAPADVAILLVGGVLNITGVVLSLYAMQRDEASVVAALFQMVPLFAYLLGWLVLGETLTLLQAAAGLLILAGAVGITLDLSRGRIVVKGTVLWRMALASLLIATNAVLFKRVAISEDFWVSTFWSYVSLALFGVAVFGLVASYRRQFLGTLRKNRLGVVGLNALNELGAVVGYVMISYASLLVPVALVSVTSGFQPLMVFAIGVVLTLAFPRLGREKLTRRQVTQKVVAMVVILAGTWLLER